MPKDCRTVACIVVRSSRAFVWLGHMPIMNWSVRRLLEVRGLDRIICVADSKLKSQAAKLLAKDKIDVTGIPASVKTDRELDRWLSAATGPASDANVVLVLKPTSPFLPAAKIEAVMNQVMAKKVVTSCTAREVDAYVRISAANPDAPVSRLTAHAEVATCRAFAPASVQEKYNRFAPVPVDLVESLDVSVPDNLRMAQALVKAGAV